jgi:probable rRNA maturation factor
VGSEEKTVMPVSVEIQFRDAKWETLLTRKAVREACEATFKKKEVTVVLANDVFIRKLNRDFRGKDKPTNVLSFPGDADNLGDIVLARQTIVREAKEQGKTPRDHAVHLVVHGMLHLLGYDHEKAKDAEIMESLEIKILKKLGVSNPYLWKHQ